MTLLISSICIGQKVNVFKSDSLLIYAIEKKIVPEVLNSYPEGWYLMVEVKPRYNEKQKKRYFKKYWYKN